MIEKEERNARDRAWAEAVLKEKRRADALLAELDRLRTDRRAPIRGYWHGVFLDGRNEHGSHVLMLPQRSIELDQDSNGDFLKEDAEKILREAEANGFRVGDAVVVTFEQCLDEGFFSHYEFVGLSSEMTALLYGTAAEQHAEAARALSNRSQEGRDAD